MQKLADISLFESVTANHIASGVRSSYNIDVLSSQSAIIFNDLASYTTHAVESTAAKDIISSNLTNTQQQTIVRMVLLGLENDALTTVKYEEKEDPFIASVLHVFMDVVLKKILEDPRLKPQKKWWRSARKQIDFIEEQAYKWGWDNRNDYANALQNRASSTGTSTQTGQNTASQGAQPANSTVSTTTTTTPSVVKNPFSLNETYADAVQKATIAEIYDVMQTLEKKYHLKRPIDINKWLITRHKEWSNRLKDGLHDVFNVFSKNVEDLQNYVQAKRQQSKA